MYVHSCVCLCIFFVSKHACVHLSVCMCEHVNRFFCMCVSIYICGCEHVHVCICDHAPVFEVMYAYKCMSIIFIIKSVLPFATDYGTIC